MQDGSATGFVFDAATPQALADAICYMLRFQQEATAMGKKARETIIKEYDICLVAQRYVRLYKTLAG